MPTTTASPASIFPGEFERFRDDPSYVDTPASLQPDRMEVYGILDAVERLGVPERHIDFEGTDPTA